MYVLLLFATLLAISHGFNEALVYSTCENHEYRCDNSQCIALEERCDGKNDCTDLSDEFNCELEHCHEDEFFKCKNERCISKTFVCDNDNDCLDYSDEENCDEFRAIINQKNASCNVKDSWKCADSICIPKEFVCDGNMDCPDSSDETIGCTKNIECTEFKCHNGHCIPTEFKCDGQDDCHDNSDELNCEVHIPPAECTIDARKFLCHDNITCINIHKACDSHPDCPDQSDESFDCLQLCEHFNCSHDCYRLPTGPKCLCPNGYKTIDDRHCQDINECEIYGICDQHCDNLPGTYRCHCDIGFLLQDDEKTCKAIGVEPILIFTSKHQIRSYSLKSNILKTIVENLNQSIGIDVDDNYIYWSDIYSGHECISRVSRNGHIRDVLITSGIGAAEGLAIDWVTGNIYFTDTEKQHIGVCINDGSICSILINKYIDMPRGIALHPHYGEMFWSDWGKKPQIRKSLMDGSNDITFISDNIYWPNDLAVDYPNDRLYWTDAKTMTLESIKMDGTDRRIILQNVAKHPYGIAIFEDNIYWSDWVTHTIQSCNKFTGKNHSVIIKEDDLIYGITVYHPANRQLIKNPCLHSFCSHICLMKGTTYSCSCPPDKELNMDGHTCRDILKKQALIVGADNMLIQINYENMGRHTTTALPNPVKSIGAMAYNPINNTLYVTDLISEKIFAISLHSQLSIELNIVGIGKIKAMDYDHLGNNLYWCDEDKSTIEVINLNTMARKVLIHDIDGETPQSIALIPEEGIMFISFERATGAESHIDRFLMDGSERTHCIDRGLEGPISLLYDKDLHKIFFSDATSGNIAMTSIECDERHDSGRSFAPISMATLKKDLFWVDTNSNRINFIDKSNMDYLVKEIYLDISFVDRMQIVSVTPENVPYNPCQKNNGNCSHLCLVAHKNIVCSCPNGYDLRDDNSTCTKRVECNSNEFNCHQSNKCIPKSYHCNGHIDCNHGEDEENCKNFQHCPTDTFQCNDGECIKSEFVCNNKYDCLDKSDEHNCTHLVDRCLPGHFACNNGVCIGEQFLCNKINDCSDGEDEENCAKLTCEIDEFRCNSGACIPKNWECDHKYDCSDLSDEHANCEPCPKDSFVCHNGHCIDSNLVCDGTNDCGDESDEEHCEDQKAVCQSTEFQCTSNTTICIHKNSVCDGHSDCPHHEDEANCTDCHIEEFSCKNKKCIAIQWICDRVDDCGDNSDEDPILCSHDGSHYGQQLNTYKPLAPCNGGFRCKNNGQCLDYSNVCNGKIDCTDGSDEGGACQTVCESSNNPCSQTCVKTPIGAVCQCKKGFILNGNGHDCDDFNECTANPPVCSQLCINQQGGYFCDCFDGYLLTLDKKSCKSTGRAMSMIFNSNNQIRELSQMENSLKILYSAEQAPKITDLDVDINENYIYFSIEQAEIILRIHRITKEKQQMVHLGNPQKLAVDWISHNVYFVNANPNSKTISICNFNSKTSASLIPIDFHGKVSAITVDPINKYLFYSLVSWWMFNSPTFIIYRTNLDGSDIRELIKSSKGHITGLSCDFNKKQLYYVDQHNGQVNRISYNGSIPYTLIKNLTMANDLNFFENHLYIMIKNGYIEKCKLYDDVKCDRFKLNNYANLFAIFQESRQPIIKKDNNNLCKDNSCSHLCIPTKINFKCLCPDGSSVAPGVKCIKTMVKEADEQMDNDERIFNHITHESIKQDEHKTSLVAAGIVVPLLSVLIVLGLFYTIKKRNRPTFDLRLRFNNPVYNLQCDEVIEEKNNILQPGMHEYINPSTNGDNNRRNSLNLC